MQFKPIRPITAIAQSLTRPEILVGGNEFGYAICCLKTHQILAQNLLISTMDLAVITSLDETLSRFKSVKKSIRQSFRRKKRTEEETISPNSTIKPLKNGILVGFYIFFRPK